MRSVPLFRPVHLPAMASAVDAVLASGQIAVGPAVSQFERSFAALIEQPHTLLVSDMSMALLMALKVGGIGAGDDVVTSPFACMSTNAPIAHAGARAVWADVDEGTGMPTADHIEQALTDRTRAVLVYHAAGYPADIEAIAALCRRRGLLLVEDCDTALGAFVNERPVGSFGDFAVWSFYANRQLHGGEGGALSCRSQAHAQRALRLRRFGIDLPRFRDSDGEIAADFDIPEIGWAGTMNAVNCALASVQLPTLAARQRRAAEIALSYDLALAEVAGWQATPVSRGCRSAYWAYLVTTENARAAMVELKRHGVGTSGLHDRTDRYSGFGATSRPLPGLDAWMATHLALPCGDWMTEDDVSHVIQTIRQLTPTLS